MRKDILCPGLALLLRLGLRTCDDLPEAPAGKGPSSAPKGGAPTQELRVASHGDEMWLNSTSLLDSGAFYDKVGPDQQPFSLIQFGSA